MRADVRSLSPALPQTYAPPPPPRSVFSTETSGCGCDFTGGGAVVDHRVPPGQWSLWVRLPKTQPGRETDVLATSAGPLWRQPQCAGFCSPAVFCAMAIDDGSLGLRREQGNRKTTPGPPGRVSDPEDHSCHFCEALHFPSDRIVPWADHRRVYLGRWPVLTPAPRSPDFTEIYV